MIKGSRAGISSRLLYVHLDADVLLFKKPRVVGKRLSFGYENFVVAFPQFFFYHDALHYWQSPFPKLLKIGSAVSSLLFER